MNYECCGLVAWYQIFSSYISLLSSGCCRLCHCCSLWQDIPGLPSLAKITVFLPFLLCLHPLLPLQNCRCRSAVGDIFTDDQAKHQKQW